MKFSFQWTFFGFSTLPTGHAVGKEALFNEQPLYFDCNFWDLFIKTVIQGQGNTVQIMGKFESIRISGQLGKFWGIWKKFQEYCPNLCTFWHQWNPTPLAFAKATLVTSPPSHWRCQFLFVLQNHCTTCRSHTRSQHISCLLQALLPCVLVGDLFHASQLVKLHIHLANVWPNKSKRVWANACRAFTPAFATDVRAFPLTSRCDKDTPIVYTFVRHSSGISFDVRSFTAYQANIGKWRANMAKHVSSHLLQSPHLANAYVRLCLAKHIC